MSRLSKIKSELSKQKVDAILVSSVPQITYLTGYSNFSVEEREAFLIITTDKQYILTDARYSEAVKNSVKEFELLEIGGEFPTKKILEDLKDKYKINILGIEENNINVSEYKVIKKIFKKTKHFTLHHLRSVKTSDEMKKIKKACQIGDQAFEFIIKQIREGQTEIEIANLLEDFVKKMGAKMSFDTIIAFSSNASVPHHHTGETKITEKKGQFIKMDFGVKYKNYCSDMTRTIFWGKPSEKQIKIYQTVKKSQEKAVEFLNGELKTKKEIKASLVDKVARDFIVSEGFSLIPHSLGHGIGLEVHEPPYLSTKSRSILQEGMVFSIEPGIYIERFGGIRIEDLYAIQKGKLVQLTNSSKELITI